MSETARTGPWTRLGRIVLAELAETAAQLALLLLALWGLAAMLGVDGASSPLVLLQQLGEDRSRMPVLPRLWQGLSVSAVLVGGSLGLALPIALLLGGWSLVSPAAERLRWAATALSAIPLVAAGSLLQQLLGNSLAYPIIALAFTELTLGQLAAQLRSELARERSREYLDTIRAAGQSVWLAAWRPLLGITIGAARPRIPHLLGATIVAERIFRLDGLANLVFSGLERRGDPAVLVWVALLGFAAVRGLRLAEQLVVALLDPRRGAEALVAAPLGRERGRWLWPHWAALFGETLHLGERLASVARRLLGATASTWRGVRGLAVLGWYGGPVEWLRLALAGATLAAAAALAGVCAAGWTPGEAGSVIHPPFAPPAPGRWLGADALGRDLASQLLRAGHNMAGPLALGLAVPLLLGGLGGAWSGSGGGRARRVADRAVELVEALPRLVVLLAVLWVIPVDGAYVWRVMAAAGLLHLPLVYLGLRDHVRRVAVEGFLEAQRALGAAPWRVLLLHLLWYNGRGALAIQAALLTGQLLVTEVTLGYLGYCQADDDLVTWGRLVYVGLADPAPVSGPWNPWVRWAPLAVLGVVCVACAIVADAVDRAAQLGEREDP